MIHGLRVLYSLLREKLKTFTRSPEWPRVRDEHLRLFPTCSACGGSARLQVHHIRPFHKFPNSELDPKNLQTLCMGPSECHCRIGHGGAFHYFNPRVVPHAREALNDPPARPRVEVEAERARLLNEP